MKKISVKASFCVYRYWDVCVGRCIRIYAEVLSESIILSIQIPGVDVYASAQKSSAKASFYVYRNRRVCKEHCIRFYEEAFSESIILRIQILGHLRGAMYTLLWRTFRESIILRMQMPEGRACIVYASAQKPSVKASFCVYKYQSVKVIAYVFTRSL